ncbi:MAG: putative lipid II flippase FtsW [Candidatus Sumerlaeaceae bacterium]
MSGLTLLPIRNHAKWLFTLTLILTGIGVVFVLSASAPYAARDEMRMFTISLRDGNLPEGAPTVHGAKFFVRQLIWALFSIVVMWRISLTDSRFHADHSKWYLLAAIVMLALVFVPHIGIQRNGAHRWIGFGPVQIQPSEFAKIALILHCAVQLATQRGGAPRKFGFFLDFLPLLAVLGVLVGLIIIEPDLGTCMVLGIIAFSMWAVGGVPIRYLASMILLGVGFVVVAVLAEPYRMRRLFAFLDPEQDPLGAGYHLLNSLIAVGTGGLTGRGIGQGPSKYLFLSECHTDFIFSIICEEAGFVGACIVLLLFLAFVIVGFDVAKRVEEIEQKLIAVGVTVMIGAQAFGNMAVAIGLLPTKGLALPFISYGGSSLLANMFAVGILIRIATEIEYDHAESQIETAAYGPRVRAL